MQGYWISLVNFLREAPPVFFLAMGVSVFGFLFLAWVVMRVRHRQLRAELQEKERDKQEYEKERTSLMEENIELMDKMSEQLDTAIDMEDDKQRAEKEILSCVAEIKKLEKVREEIREKLKGSHERNDKLVRELQLKDKKIRRLKVQAKNLRNRLRDYRNKSALESNHKLVVDMVQTLGRVAQILTSLHEVSTRNNEAALDIINKEITATMQDVRQKISGRNGQNAIGGRQASLMKAS